jgi:hypothetical protein
VVSAGIETAHAGYLAATVPFDILDGTFAETIPEIAITEAGVYVITSALDGSSNPAAETMINTVDGDEPAPQYGPNGIPPPHAGPQP